MYYVLHEKILGFLNYFLQLSESEKEKVSNSNRTVTFFRKGKKKKKTEQTGGINC